MNQQKQTKKQQAQSKLEELLSCDDDRIALSAAKEILSQKEEEKLDEAIQLEVTIRVVTG